MIAALIIIAVFLLFAGGAMAANSQPKTLARDLQGKSAADIASQVKSVIASALPFGFNVEIPFLMANQETGIASGTFSPAFLATNSLFNRHVGNGVEGIPNSDGVWNGNVYYTPSGEDLRSFDSLEDSVRDFVQLMGESLYSDALNAWSRNDIAAYIEAIVKAGYAQNPNEGTQLTALAHRFGYLA